ncbi:hypothetical protein Acr_00g0103660 [Actinidia rufa]|uniref:Uncharacterized protein n=1 Tax=Actinidia rufa TaxID=165716 RepID=A0A7J0E0T0_9ERIC|nr:hypothetical protein Acr_00g0103660 [Actinidia rufa]
MADDDEIEVLLATSDDGKSDWVLDSGSAYHLCRDREVFSTYAPDAKGCSFDASGGILRVSKGNKEMLWGKKTGGLYRLEGSVQTRGATVRHGSSGIREKNGQGKQPLHRGTQSKRKGTWRIRSGTRMQEDALGYVRKSGQTRVVQPVQDVHREAQRKETKSILRSCTAKGAATPKRVSFALDLISGDVLSSCAHKGGKKEPRQLTNLALLEVSRHSGFIRGIGFRRFCFYLGESSDTAATAVMADDDEIEVLLATSDDGKSDWVLDSGSAYHLCRDREVFSTYAPDAKGCSFDASGGILRVSKGNKEMLWGKKTGGLYRLEGSVQTRGATVRHGSSGIREKNGQGKQPLHRGTQSKRKGTWRIRSGTRMQEDALGYVRKSGQTRVVQPVQDVHREAQRKETKSILRSCTAKGAATPEASLFCSRFD